MLLKKVICNSNFVTCNLLLPNTVYRHRNISLLNILPSLSSLAYCNTLRNKLHYTTVVHRPTAIRLVAQFRTPPRAATSFAVYQWHVGVVGSFVSKQYYSPHVLTRSFTTCQTSDVNGTPPHFIISVSVVL